MRLATFNLENLGSQLTGGPPLEETLDALRSQIAALEADVLCLQEINAQRPRGGGPRQLQALEKLLVGTLCETYHLAAPRGTEGKGYGGVHNLVTLSRWPIAKSESLWHDLVTPPCYRDATANPHDAVPQEICWDRPILHCELFLPDGPPVHVVNLHLRAPLAAPVSGQKSSTSTWRSLRGGPKALTSR